jgi:hypothetical protein
MRRSLEAVLETPVSISIVTKGTLVARDRDLLAELSRRRHIEPATPHPRQRLRALPSVLRLDRQIREIVLDKFRAHAPEVAARWDVDYPGSHPRAAVRREVDARVRAAVRPTPLETGNLYETASPEPSAA